MDDLFQLANWPSLLSLERGCSSPGDSSCAAKESVRADIVLCLSGAQGG